MLYLLWSLINIILFIFFILLCLKATKLIREKAGLFSAIVFVFGLLSFVSSSNRNKDHHDAGTDRIRIWNFIPEDSQSTTGNHTLRIALQKTWISTYELGVQYSTDQQHLNIPESAWSSITGMVSGTAWHPQFVSVKRTNDNNRFDYAVSGVTEWTLLGVTVYSQNKDYNGVATIR